MAEKEYIERGAVLALKQPIGAYGMDICSAEVKEIPTADVVEVRHGVWIEDYTRQFFDESYETGYHCSRCNRTVAVAHELYDTKGRGLLHNLFPYCHCGAKMDGGAE